MSVDQTTSVWFTSNSPVPVALPRTTHSVRLIPIIPYSNVNYQRDGKLGDLSHRVAQRRTHLRYRGFGHFEHELVVDLHDHPGRCLRLPQPPVDVDHRSLDEISSRALHGGIDGRALGRLPAGNVYRIDIGEMQPAAKNSLDVAYLSRLLP